MQSLTKGREQAREVILQQTIFYNVFILCLWLRSIRRSNQGVWFINFLSQIFFNDVNHRYRAAILKKSYLWLLPFYMAVTTYCYYEKESYRTSFNHCATALKNDQESQKREES